MSADEPCIHLLDPATCTMCNGRDRRERAARCEVTRLFAAKFPGTRCDECGRTIEVGDLMGRTARNAYVGACCASIRN